MNALRWPARLVAAPAVEAFSPADIVLLSPDAEQPLLELDPTKVIELFWPGGPVLRAVDSAPCWGAAEQPLLEQDPTKVTWNCLLSRSCFGLNWLA